MKRIIAAVVLALLFHVILFCVKPSWFKSERMEDKKRPAVTITMSYKMPVKPPPLKKPPEKIKKIKKKKVVKPKKVEKKKPAPVKTEEIPEKLPEPEPIIEEVVEEKAEPVEEEIIEEAAVITDDEEQDGAPPPEGTAAEVVTDAEPLYRMNPEPRYPRMAKKRGYQGTVLVDVLVSENGRVKNLILSESCGYKILDNAALEAVKDWLFEPGKEGDKPVEMWVQVPVRFELR